MITPTWSLQTRSHARVLLLEFSMRNLVDADVSRYHLQQSGNRRKCDYHCFNNDLLFEAGTVMLAIARHEGGVHDRKSRSPLSFENFPQGATPGFVTKRSPRPPSRPVSTVTFGYIRIKKGGITQGGPRCRFNCQNSQSRCTSCSLSANSRRKLYPSHD